MDINTFIDNFSGQFDDTTSKRSSLEIMPGLDMEWRFRERFELLTVA